MELFEILIDVFVSGLFQVPGAAVRWLLWRKKSYRDYRQDGLQNFLFSLLVYAALIGVVLLVFSF